MSSQLVLIQKKLPQSYRKKILVSIFLPQSIEKLTQIKSKKQTLAELSSRFGVHANQILCGKNSFWKAEQQEFFLKIDLKKKFFSVLKCHF